MSLAKTVNARERIAAADLLVAQAAACGCNWRRRRRSWRSVDTDTLEEGMLLPSSNAGFTRPPVPREKREAAGELLQVVLVPLGRGVRERVASIRTEQPRRHEVGLLGGDGAPDRSPSRC